MASDVATEKPAVYQDPASPLETRVADLLARLTLDEKVALMAGAEAFKLMGVERLGVPRLGMSDGPTGVRSNTGQMATVFPVAVALAATFNPAVTHEVGAAIAREAKALGEQVVLAPTINIVRTPLWGRNFETYSEDPYLTGELGIGFVAGLQGEGIGASLKHYAANNQEERRMEVSVQVDERTLREIYLSAFEAVVKATNPWTVMASYNKLRGAYATANSHLLQDILKGAWGYDGVVVSDWGAVHSTEPAANGGLDLEMPGPANHFGERLVSAVKAGAVEPARIDDAARRLVRLILRAGLLDGARLEGELRSERHRVIARRAAQEGIVLLKNDGGLLPLAAEAIKTIAVIGPNANFVRLQGDGSSRVSTDRWPTPVESLAARLPKAHVVYEQGCDAEPVPPQAQPRMFSPTEMREAPGLTAEYFEHADFSGEPIRTSHERRLFRWVSTRGPRHIANRFAALRWAFTLARGGRGPRSSSDPRRRRPVGSPSARRTLIDLGDPGQEDFDHPTSAVALRRTAGVELKGGQPYRFSLEYEWATARTGDGFETLSLGVRQPPGETEKAIAAARAADVAVVVVGSASTTESEGYDRRDIRLPGDQDLLVEQIAAANPRTIVVVNAGAAMAMPWIDKVPAALQLWLPGEEGPDALTDILLGVVSPSGRLPVTFPKRIEDSSAYGFYPGADTVTYGEGLAVGYRHFDQNDIAPLFAFGHGLTYSTFDYAGLSVPAAVAIGQPAPVSLTLTNTGARAASEVVQVYIGPVAPHRPTPPKSFCAALRRSLLRPGESRIVTLELSSPCAFARFDDDDDRWVIDPGVYDLYRLATSTSASNSGSP